MCKAFADAHLDPELSEMRFNVFIPDDGPAAAVAATPTHGIGRHQDTNINRGSAPQLPYRAVVLTLYVDSGTMKVVGASAVPKDHRTEVRFDTTLDERDCPGGGALSKSLFPDSMTTYAIPETANIMAMHTVSRGGKGHFGPPHIPPTLKDSAHSQEIQKASHNLRKF
jgi:hypothetical protein